MPDIIYDIHNPTQARRVIYDGIRNKEIVIEAGDTKRSVCLAENIVKAIRNKVDDLEITEIKSAAIIPSSISLEKPTLTLPGLKKSHN